jgi:prephenate dehydratase
MTVEDHEPFTHLRLRVAAEDDPGALARLLGHFQNLNITPRRIEAEFATTGLMHVQIDVCGMSEARLTLIAAKIAQHVPVVNVYWHRL